MASRQTTTFAPRSGDTVPIMAFGARSGGNDWFSTLRNPQSTNFAQAMFAPGGLEAATGKYIVVADGYAHRADAWRFDPAYGLADVELNRLKAQGLELVFITPQQAGVFAIANRIGLEYTKLVTGSEDCPEDAHFIDFAGNPPTAVNFSHGTGALSLRRPRAVNIQFSSGLFGDGPAAQLVKHHGTCFLNASKLLTPQGIAAVLDGSINSNALATMLDWYPRIVSFVLAKTLCGAGLMIIDGLGLEAVSNALGADKSGLLGVAWNDKNIRSNAGIAVVTNRDALARAGAALYATTI